MSEEKKTELCSCGNFMAAAKKVHVREKLNILKERIRIEDKERTALI